MYYVLCIISTDWLVSIVIVRQLARVAGQSPHLAPGMHSRENYYMSNNLRITYEPDTSLERYGDGKKQK